VDSAVPLAKQIGAYSQNSVDLVEVIQRCRRAKHILHRALTGFPGYLAGECAPESSRALFERAVYSDPGGAAWLNPFGQDNWNYTIALAKEIVALGFDEIQFDYVRFPGQAGTLFWGTDYNEEARVATIAGFLARAQKNCVRPACSSPPTFSGLTTATDDDQHTGQRLRDLAPYVDYVYPMVYPDTWVEASSLLTRGLQIKIAPKQSNAHTMSFTTVTSAQLRKHQPRCVCGCKRTRGAAIRVAQYRLQKKAATDVGSSGWMFWSGTGVYDPKMFDPPTPSDKRHIFEEHPIQ